MNREDYTSIETNKSDSGYGWLYEVDLNDNYFYGEGDEYVEVNFDDFID